MPVPMPLRISIAIAAAAIYFLSGLSPFFLWIAPIPLFVLVLHGASNLWLVFLAYFLGNFSQGFYAYYHTAYPIWPIGLQVGIESIFFTAVLWLAGFLIRRFQSWHTVFAFPVFWVSYLYLSILLAGDSNIGNL